MLLPLNQEEREGSTCSLVWLLLSDAVFTCRAINRLNIMKYVLLINIIKCLHSKSKLSNIKVGRKPSHRQPCWKLSCDMRTAAKAPLVSTKCSCTLCHTFNKVLEIFLRDFGPSHHICKLHIHDENHSKVLTMR